MNKLELDTNLDTIDIKDKLIQLTRAQIQLLVDEQPALAKLIPRYLLQPDQKMKLKLFK